MHITDNECVSVSAKRKWIKQLESCLPPRANGCSFKVNGRFLDPLFKIHYGERDASERIERSLRSINKNQSNERRHQRPKLNDAGASVFRVLASSRRQACVFRANKWNFASPTEEFMGKEVMGVTFLLSKKKKTNTWLRSVMQKSRRSTLAITN